MPPSGKPPQDDRLEQDDSSLETANEYFGLGALRLQSAAASSEALSAMSHAPRDNDAELTPQLRFTLFP